MPLVPADWTVTRSTKAIRYVGDGHTGANPSYATVLELHRWLQDLADDPEFTGDDQIDIISVNPTDKKTDNYVILLNGFNIDDVAAEHLYDGSIEQNNGDDIYDGIVNYGNAGVRIQIIQNGAVIANDFWNTNGGLNADAAQGISHRFLLKVRSAGADIDGRRLIGITREFGKTYREFRINGTNRGNNVLALANEADTNNQTAEGTVATWTSITNLNEGYTLQDVDGNGTNEAYYSQWDRDIYTINQLYEYLKYLTREGSTSTLYGLSGELFRGITHEIDVDTPTGTFVEPEPVSWTGGTGQLLAIDSTTAPTKMWIQLLTGTAPGDNVTITGGTSGATCLVNVNVVERTVSTPFLGNSTGNAILGAFGFGVQAADLSANDRLIDLAGNTIAPPNNVTFQVLGLVANEDQVLVAPWDGTSTDAEGNPVPQYNQFSLQTALTGTAETAVVVSTAIPSDTPASGTIRIQVASGLYRRISYTSWSGSTFTIPSTDFSADNAAAGNDVFISYIDKLAASTGESFTVVYSADRNLMIRVRDGKATPIKEFITSAVLGSSGGSVTAIRTSDA